MLHGQQVSGNILEGGGVKLMYVTDVCHAAEGIVRLPPLSLERGLLERKIAQELCPAPKAGGSGDACCFSPCCCCRRRTVPGRGVARHAECFCR